MTRLQSALFFLLITGTKACTDEELKTIDAWLESEKLNMFGDSPDMMYAGGNPLFDETTGETTSRCDYLMSKYSAEPWNNIAENNVDIGIPTKPPLDKEENYEILPIGMTGGVTVGETTNDVESPATKPPLEKEENPEIQPFEVTVGETVGENNNDVDPPVTKPPTEKEDYEILPIGTGDDVDPPVTKPPTEKEDYEIKPIGTGDDGKQTDIAGDGDGGDKDVNGLENEVTSSASVATSALFLIGASLVTSFFFN